MQIVGRVSRDRSTRRGDAQEYGECNKADETATHAIPASRESIGQPAFQKRDFGAKVEVDADNPSSLRLGRDHFILIIADERRSTVRVDRFKDLRSAGKSG
jgi:hypothetical protein